MNIEAMEPVNQPRRGTTIGFAQSPEGRPCIQMTFDEEQWVLFTTKTINEAVTTMEYLREDLGVPSLPGAPIDWRISLKTQELHLIQREEAGEDVLGVYVRAQDFDRLVGKHFGL